MASLVISVTLVPLLCFFLLDEKKAKDYQLKKLSDTGLGSRLFNGYKKLLNFFVTHLTLSMIISIALTAVFIVVIVSTPMALLPDMDMGMIQIQIGTPIGSTLDDKQPSVHRSKRSFFATYRNSTIIIIWCNRTKQASRSI